MTTPRIVIIGAGNMGSSLIGGLMQNGHPPTKLCATDPSSEKREFLQRTFNINTSADNQEAVATADVIIFAVKPHHFAAIAKAIQPVVSTRKPLIISIATGIRIASMQRWFGNQIAIVRAMPNTPALIRCGASGLYANASVTPEQHNLAESILRAVGVTVWLSDEGLLDVVTALSGSGPAYFFHMMEALQLAAEELGLPPDTAKLLTLQTALGAARMALESCTSLA